MTWIRVLSYGESQGRLRLLYDCVKAPDGAIDNIMAAHSLRPHSMEGHLALYKNVLHHSANRLPPWFLEALGVRVSVLNGCGYCRDHHFAGMARLREEARLPPLALANFEGGSPSAPFQNKERAALAYADLLTIRPASATAREIGRLRQAGYDDGEILEINQVVAYFAYANRTVLGLGVEVAGEKLGLAPRNADDPADFRHA